jgi:asparagine synthase (glutamine-hydrolysing)
MGCWLSGGLDSSALTALARPHVPELHTFAAGLASAPDLRFARKIADHLDADHHEVIVTLEELLAALPDVIYHLESFDALLVRSSITNYLAAKRAADYVGSVFSGEGADELFGGYAYLRELEPHELSSELADMAQRLHNTALQRVDRCASSHGLIAHVPFLDLDVVEFAMQIPAELKLWRDDATTEKWILRQALADVLPDEVLWRRKAKFWQGAGVGDLLARYAEENVTNMLWRRKPKFWQGAGVGDLLARYAEENVTNNDFRCERSLPNGWSLDSKEELMYYRIFREHFGELNDLSWMGRTKGAPRQ